MGRDKAFLPWPNSDLLLWQRQWRVLEELLPEEIFWSGALRSELPTNIRVIPDAILSAGPLAILFEKDVLRTAAVALFVTFVSRLSSFDKLRMKGSE